MLIWAQILFSSDCNTPWLDSHLCPRFRYHGGQNTFLAYQSKAGGSGTPSDLASGCFWSHTLKKLLIWAVGSGLGLVGLHNTLALQPSWSPIPIPWRRDHLCGITIKGKWERDALWPGIRLFLELLPRKVADLGSDFGLVGLQNTLA